MHVELFERGRAPGGRMAAPALHDRRVDIGAAYFTVADAGFRTVVERWGRLALVREWTDTFDVYSAAGHRSSSGPMRWAARDGLRSLVRQMSGDVATESEVRALDELPHDAVVLAMPDPQAARLVGDAVEWVPYDPVITVVGGWAQRCWPVADAAFVNDDADLAMVADDGARRGDAAPVLVAHTTADRARRHLDDPDGAIAPVLAALERVLGVQERPAWTHVHRWRFAKPSATHGDEPFGLISVAGRPVGLCSDSWCPAGSPRVEAAWLSGHRLGAALAARL